MSLADELEADTSPGPSAQRKTSLADEFTADNQRPAATAIAPMDPTGSTYDNLAAGAGKAVADLGRGSAQIVRAGLEKVGQGKLADRFGLTTTQDVDEAKKRDAALMHTGAGFAGNIGGNVASMMLPLSGLARIGVPFARALVNPATYSAAAASGAVNGALQPVGTGDNRERNMLFGAGAGMAGNAVINTIGRVAQPVRAAIEPLRQRAVDVLQNAGIPLDAAQLSGSAFLNRLRSSFSDNPMTAGPHAAQVAGQRAAFNNAVLGTIGEQGPAATQEVMRRADDRIGGVFRDVLGRNSVQVTDPLLTRIGAIQQAANDEERHAVSNIANRFIAAAEGASPKLRPALLLEDGSVVAGEPGRTHLSIMANSPRNLSGKVKDSGFVDANGNYLNRDQAEAIAQLKQGPLDAAGYARSLKDASVPGQVAYGVKKDLDRLASSSDSTTAYHARQLRSAIMDGINDSLSGQDRAAFAEARQQFRNMKTIEGAIDKEGSGNISPATLANTLGQKRNRAASVYGRGDQDLVSLAQAGKMLLTDKTPNSGTTARTAMQILAPVGASVVGGSYDAYHGDYGSAATKAALMGAAALGGPRIAQSIIANPNASQYLLHGVQNVPLRSLMLAPQEVPMVGGVVRRLPGDYVSAQDQ